ncbi:MAG: Gram-negative bacterial TonB protein C-terminal [Acidobacteriota bacterium]|nr:Gram-negative bacterial TonB protein C-terminal [Acidobacteriota bacterium]
MATYLFSVRRCLLFVGLGLSGALTCAAQQQPSPAPTPAARLCEAPMPAGRPGGRGVGSGTGSATINDEVKAVFTQSEVTKKAEVLFRPEPDYTAAGDGVSWKVELRVVLCPKGYVSNIEIRSKASNDIIEKAVEAARNVRFIPAEKDGKRVAQYVIISYSHEVY